MSLWVVVGGQFGSEGKGKISAFITQKENIDICIRCGGPNSGHSFVMKEGTVRLLRQLPTGCIRPETRLLIPAGGLVDLEVLRHEIDLLGLGPKHVGVDRNAVVIDETDRQQETKLLLRERLSSTLCGVGSAVARRALRGSDVVLVGQAARHQSWLTPFVTDVSDEANVALDKGKKVLVEGTQGFALSLYHSHWYPKATSRDTTAAGFLSEVGLSPLLVTDVVMVLRTFPIRVSGDQAGPMKDEITWETLQQESGAPHPIQEMTTVTKKLRRVARFDWELAQTAVRYNRPTKIAINGLDYIDYRNADVKSVEALSSRTRGFLVQLEDTLNTPVAFCGTSPAMMFDNEPEILIRRPLRAICERAF